MPEDPKHPPKPDPTSAQEPRTHDDAFDDAMRAAEEVMEQYKNALRKLAE